ncbi:hypothetical protein F5Y03DRAFT_395003 [Xylaria venustula]|nr:hypothetical protein F5Y03DRAFT_395003 [Xylaria venustula]
MAFLLTPTYEIKPYTELGLAIIGPEPSHPDSVYFWYHTPAIPHDTWDQGLRIHQFASSHKPRALFELGPWTRIEGQQNFEQWLYETYPKDKKYTAEQLEEEDLYLKQLHIEDAVQWCPWIWIPIDRVRVVWDDARMIAYARWDEIMVEQDLACEHVIWVFEKACSL